MDLFNWLFGKKKKKVNSLPDSVKINLMGKEYEVDISADVLEKRKEYLESEEYKKEKEERDKRRKERDADYKKILKKQKEFKYYYPFFKAITAFLEIERIQYSYQKHIDIISQCLIEIENLVIGKDYDAGKKKAMSMIKKEHNNYTPNAVVIDFLENPLSYKDKLPAFHKELIVNRTTNFYEYWKAQAGSLKRKDAKKNRQQYVLDGLQKLNTELEQFSPTSEEKMSVLKWIEQIKEENWALI